VVSDHRKYGLIAAQKLLEDSSALYQSIGIVNLIDLFLCEHIAVR